MNRVCQLLNVRYPLIQAGMIWCAPWELAAAVSNAGGVGIIGAGSMYPEVLLTHIRKCKQATEKPFAVNIPMFYPDLEAIVGIVIEEKVPIVFTSAGNPAMLTQRFQSNGIKVIHVVASVKFAQKAESAGVDAVVAEGFEAGGHNGREETTTMCLIPAVKAAVKIPVIAAGGIATGRGMLAAMALGADAVQIGSRFVASVESSAHQGFKQKVVEAKEGDTMLTLKELMPVRLLRNEFFNQVQDHYSKCATVEELKALLGRARAKKGMFEGDLVEGELEIGQISAIIGEVKPAAEIVHEIISEFNIARAELAGSDYKY